MRGGVAVMSSDRHKVDSETGQLIIFSAAESDAGLWECVANNERGQGTAVAQLNLIGMTVKLLDLAEIRQH